jgi:cytochrome c553
LLLTTTSASAEYDLMQRPPWAACEYCHGERGRIDSAGVPAIAGQSPSYIAKQLADFRAGRRLSPQAQMQSALVLLESEDEAAVARYFAAQTPPFRTPGTADEPGARLYRKGDERVQPCVDCHRLTRGELADGYPFLFGLNRDYLVRQLRAFRDGSRSNDPGGVMRRQAARLSDAQIDALAGYLSGVH